MTQRVTLPPQDFQKMCKQAERDHEARKLLVLIDRVKRQIASRDHSDIVVGSPKPPVAVIGGHTGRLPGRSAPFDR